MAFEDLAIKVGFDGVSQYERDLNRVVNKTTKGFDEMADSTEKTGKGFKSVANEIPGLSSALELLTNPITLIVAGTTAAASALVDLSKRAVELDSITRKATVVFGDNLGDAKRLADELNESLGTTEAGVLRILSSTQDLLVPLEFSRNEAFALSKAIGETTKNLTLFDDEGRSAEDIAIRLQKALLGEREGLVELKIKLSEADVSQRKAALGFANLTGQADKQATVLATLQLVQEQSADAAESAANNTDSLAAKQREFNSILGEVKDIFAESIIPLLQEYGGKVLSGVKAITLFITTDRGIGTWAKSVAQNLGVVITLFDRLSNTVAGKGGSGGFIATFFRLAAQSQKFFAGLEESVIKSLFPTRVQEINRELKLLERNINAIEGDTTLGKYLKAIGQDAETLRGKAKELLKELSGLTKFDVGTGGDAQGKTEIEKIINRLKGEIDDLIDSGKKLQTTFKPIFEKTFDAGIAGGPVSTDVGLGGNGVFPELISGKTPSLISDFQEPARATIDVVDQTTNSIQKLTLSVEDLGEAFIKAGPQLGGLAQEFGKLIGQGSSTEDVLKKLESTILAGIPLLIAEFLFQTAASLGFPAGVPALLGGIALSGVGGGIQGLFARGNRAGNSASDVSSAANSSNISAANRTIVNNVYIGNDQLGRVITRTNEREQINRGNG